MQDLPRKENSGVKRIEQIKRLRVEIEKARAKSAAIKEKLIPYEDWRNRSIELIDSFFHDEESYENVDMVSESLEYSDPDSDIGGIVSSSQSDPDFDEPNPQVQVSKPASHQHNTQKKTNPQLNLQPQAPLQSIGIPYPVQQPIIARQPNTTRNNNNNTTNPMNQQVNQLRQQNYGNLPTNVVDLYQYLRSMNIKQNNLPQTNQTAGLPKQTIPKKTQAIPKKPPPAPVKNNQPQQPPKPNQHKEETKPEPPKQATPVNNSMMPRCFEAEIDMPTSRTITNAQTKFMMENIEVPISPFNYAPWNQLIDKKLKETLLQQAAQKAQEEKLTIQKAKQEKLEAQRIQQEKLAAQIAHQEKLKEQARQAQQENSKKQEQIEQQKEIKEQKKAEQAKILKQVEAIAQQKKEQKLMKEAQEKLEFKVGVSRPDFQLNKYGFYEAYGKTQITEQLKFSNQVFANHNPPEKTKELLDKIAQASKMQPKPVSQAASNTIPLPVDNLLNQHQPQLISQTQSFSPQNNTTYIPPTQQNTQQATKPPQKASQQQTPKTPQQKQTPKPQQKQQTLKSQQQQAPKTQPSKAPQNQKQKVVPLPKAQHAAQAKSSQSNVTAPKDQSEKNTRESTPQTSKIQIPTSTPKPFGQTNKPEKSLPKNQFYSPNIKNRQTKPPVTPKKSEKKLKDIEESLKKDKQMSMAMKEKSKQPSTPEKPLLSTIKIPPSPNKVPSLSPAWSLSNRQNLGAKAGFPFAQTAKVPQFQGAWSVGQKNKEESQPSFQYKRQVKKEKPNQQEKTNTDNQTKSPNNKQTQQFAGFSEVVKDFWQKKKKE